MQQPDVIVAGHICLDVIPTFEPTVDGGAPDLKPGRLVVVGGAKRSTGGPVSNTGLALHRLNVPTTLIGKVGDDLFGSEILRVLRERDPALAEGMTVVPGETSSYTVVISPPKTDRLFLHCPGANDTFGAEDVDLEPLKQARLFHFGYPPAMRRMYEDGGEEAGRLFAQAKRAGMTTSLDMVYPDPHSAAGQVDWRGWLARVLPEVDVFGPNVEELLFMLDRDRHDRWMEGDATAVDMGVLQELSDQLLGMGVAIVAIKLGERGLYLRTTGQAERWAEAGRGVPDSGAGWLGRELYSPCLKADVVGTTGAGDTTLAGLLAALWRGAGAEEAVVSAVAVGAACVEQADATSGVCDWETLEARLASGWERQAVGLELAGWQVDDDWQVHRGPGDSGSRS